MIVSNTKHLIETSPAGIGLYLLVGCVRSFSRSIKSLVIYTALDNEQNPTDTINKSTNCVSNAIGSDEITPRFRVNKKGRKINKFLVHCRARNVVKTNKQVLTKGLTPLNRKLNGKFEINYFVCFRHQD